MLAREAVLIQFLDRFFPLCLNLLALRKARENDRPFLFLIMNRDTCPPCWRGLSIFQDWDNARMILEEAPPLDEALQFIQGIALGRAAQNTHESRHDT